MFNQSPHPPAPSQQTERERIKKGGLKPAPTKIWCVGLLLLMAVLLIPHLNDKSIWGDEGWSIRFTNGDSLQDTFLQLSEDRHPPFYFFMLDLWREVAGDEEVPMRMLAVFAALLTGAMIYRLGKDLFSISAGLMALFIFVMMDKQVVFSSEVRHYTWLMLWAVASSWALVRWLENPKPYRSLVFVATVIGGLYTHSLYGLVILGHVAYGLVTMSMWKTGKGGLRTQHGLAAPLKPAPTVQQLIRAGDGLHIKESSRAESNSATLNTRPYNLLRLASLYFLAGVAYLPGLALLYYQYLKQGNITHTIPINWESVELLAPEFFGKPLALMVGLLILGAVSPFLRISPPLNPPKIKAVLLPIFGISVPLLVIGVLKDDGATLLNDRNIAMILPFMALLMGLGVTAFSGFSRTALVVFILVNGLFTTDAEYTAPPWRPVAEYIAQHQIDRQPIVYQVHGEAAAMGYHLREDVGSDIPLASIYDLENDPSIEIFSTLRFEKLGNATGFWFIYWGEESPLFGAFEEWGYRRTFSDYVLHFDNKIYMHRYDSGTILEETITTYDNLLRLHQVYAVANEGKVTIHLWWSAAQVLTQDYTVSVILLHPDGTVAAQHDSFPQEGQLPTTQWQPDQLIYDAHPLKVQPGNYQIAVKVYQLSDGQILPTAENQEYAVVGTIPQ